MVNQKAFKHYFKLFFMSMVGYTVAIVVYVYAMGVLEGSSLRFLLFIIPVIPMLFALYSQIRLLMAQDEFERKISAEAWAISAIVIGFFTFTYGFLEQAGIPHLPTFFYFPATIIGWGLIKPLIGRRYQ